MATADLFDCVRPRRKPRVMMHVVDARNPECDENPSVRLMCSKCQHETDWVEFPTVTEARRGSPCPDCNKAQGSEKA